MLYLIWESPDSGRPQLALNSEIDICRETPPRNDIPGAGATARRASPQSLEQPALPRARLATISSS